MSESEGKMTISEHLDELRVRLVRCFLATLVGFGLSFAFVDRVFAFIRKPLDNAVAGITLPEGIKIELIQSAAFEGFFTSMKLAFFAGMVLASPIIVHNIWGFVAAGLYRHERATVKYYAIPGLLLFFMGASLAYFFVMPFALDFLLSWSVERLEVGSFLHLNKYISLIAWAMLVFGLMFQLPLVMVFLMRLGVVTPEWFRRFRRHSIVVSFAVAMILTPPDVISQVALAGCMTLLYEIAILVGERFARPRDERGPADPKGSGSDPDSGDDKAAPDGTSAPDQEGADDETKGENS